MHASPEVEFHRRYGWRPAPNLKQSFVHRAACVDVQTNRDGWRDKDIDEKCEQAEATGAQKILLLGDSEAYGWGLNADQRQGEVLERLSEVNGSPMLVFNLACPGYEPGQEFLVLKDFYDRIKPDIVVLYLNKNDFGDGALPYVWFAPRRRVYRPFFDLTGRQVFGKYIRRRPSLFFQSKPVLRHLHLRFTLDMLMYAFEDWYFSSRDVGVVNSSHLIVEDEGRPSKIVLGDISVVSEAKSIFDQAKTRTFQILKSIDEYCKERGSRFIVHFPYNVSSSAAYGFRETASYLRDMNIELVSEYEKLLPYRDWSENCLDGHGNAIANYWNAEALFRYFKPDIDEIKPCLQKVVCDQFHPQVMRSVNLLSGQGWQRLKDGAFVVRGGRRAALLVPINTIIKDRKQHAVTWIEVQVCGRLIARSSISLPEGPVFSLRDGAGRLVVGLSTRGSFRCSLRIPADKNFSLGLLSIVSEAGVPEETMLALDEVRGKAYIGPEPPHHETLELLKQGQTLVERNVPSRWKKVDAQHHGMVDNVEINGTRLRVKGWVLNKTTKRAPPFVALFIGSTCLGLVSPKKTRSRVIETHRLANGEPTGFAFNIDLSTRGNGLSGALAVLSLELAFDEYQKLSLRSGIGTFHWAPDHQTLVRDEE